MKVGLVGSGLQGRRRAAALDHEHDDCLVLVADVHYAAAEKLASRYGCRALPDWRSVVESDAIDAVIVCTPPNLHAEIAIAALDAGKHVLCEKPLGRTLAEAEAIVTAAQRSGRCLKCGFNHRHYPHIERARRWYDQGLIGDAIFVRCRHGIGGRSGYEREWRAQREISGGGQLMDQGLHGLDLARWFLGEFTHATGILTTSFWEIDPLEDNAFALLRTDSGKIASLHCSWTQWKNLFSFELYGRDGYIAIEGLGGSYDTARVTLAPRLPLAPFREETIEYRGNDRSWLGEWREFKAAVAEEREPLGSGRDGL